MNSGADAHSVRTRQAAQPAQSGLQLDLIPMVRDYISLTKPRIISLLLLTTVATMVVLAVAVAPPSSVTRRVTVYVPAFV